ncbi:efflux RND transporter periplasmic adaptor subunit [Robbsia sp. Bb-Pol-6]|uniref:Efflux RND transporter periplasmic adaptor subunit n=1 Tax=Robbsia betulipollinis TaxID=2981849 RepID=A0ABT3ZLU6_9BURK|nr:efflux RND transporter periplasmic adaptor subunit [Robbsia betulipollinis]MCY0387518.1 efflux RND transporter periplasmic adaptor subunit [Robbsia betulipollinis]
MRVDRVKYRLICAVSGAALLALAACGEKKQAAPPPGPVQVGVVTVQPQSVAVDTELPGRTTPYRVAEVRARVDGIVLKRNFVEGSDVKEGQVLYQIDPAPYQAALMSAQATLAKAQASLTSSRAQAGRYKTLVAANAVSKQSYDDAVATQGQGQADVAAGQAAVRTAEINLGYTTVRSPIAGRIGKASVTEGAYVQSSAATLLATVQQIAPLYVDLTQSSNALLRMRRNLAAGSLQSAGANATKVALVLDDGTVMPDTGHLEFTDVTVDQNTGTTTVRAVFPNAQRNLLPGMFVRARVQEATNDRALLVPMQGVTRDQKGIPTAMVVGADNKVELRNLTTTQTIGSKWVVTAGLNPGDRVIVEGTQKAKPGQTVSPVAANLPAPSSVSADSSGADGGKDGATTMAASAVAGASAAPAVGASSTLQ